MNTFRQRAHWVMQKNKQKKTNIFSVYNQYLATPFKPKSCQMVQKDEIIGFFE